MKKFFSFFLCALMVVSMIASASAASVKPDKEYAAAKDGDVLYTANFKDPAYGVLYTGNTATYTVSADGKSVTVQNKDDANAADYWGVMIESLGAANGEKYTVTYKVKSNGTIGKNNSVGVSGIWSGVKEEKFYNAYGNYSTVDDKGSNAERRISLSLGGSKVGDYNTDVKNVDVDKDGFVSAKQEIDTAAKKIRIYLMIGGKWYQAIEKDFTDFDAKKACMSFALYSWYTVVDTTVKDFKIYKGIGLTDDQLNPKPAATTTPASPATFDAGIVLAAVATLAGAGVVVSKKRK